MVGRGGGGGYVHKFSSRMDLLIIIYCLEVPKFVVITSCLLLVFLCMQTLWLQLSTFTVLKPRSCKSYDFNLIFIVQKIISSGPKTLLFINITVIIWRRL